MELAFNVTKITLLVLMLLNVMLTALFPIASIAIPFLHVLPVILAIFYLLTFLLVRFDVISFIAELVLTLLDVLIVYRAIALLTIFVYLIVPLELSAWEQVLIYHVTHALLITNSAWLVYFLATRLLAHLVHQYPISQQTILVFSATALISPIACNVTLPPLAQTALIPKLFSMGLVFSGNAKSSTAKCARLRTVHSAQRVRQGLITTHPL
jgi:hypothetical protein